MKTAFLYAGQGSQRVGMGQDFYVQKKTYRRLLDSLEPEFDLKRMMHEGPLEELSKTEYTQACMAAYAAGVTAVLAEEGIVPSAACGLSLGEYGALHAAGVFDAVSYVELVTYRGKEMKKASEGVSCSMSAVLGLNSESITTICEEICEEIADCSGSRFLTAANFNCPGQTVICGDETSVAEAEARMKNRGAKRCIRLNVSGPFHTRVMAPAGEALRSYMQKMDFGIPAIPVALNATGTFYQKNENLRELLVRQVQSSVYLEKDLRALLEAGYTGFIEIGPGNNMAGFLKKTAKDMGIRVQIVSIDRVGDLEKAKQMVLGT